MDADWITWSPLAVSGAGAAVLVVQYAVLGANAEDMGRVPPVLHAYFAATGASALALHVASVAALCREGGSRAHTAVLLGACTAYAALQLAFLPLARHRPGTATNRVGVRACLVLLCVPAIVVFVLAVARDAALAASLALIVVVHAVANDAVAFAALY
jgi:hypothetical protein